MKKFNLILVIFIFMSVNIAKLNADNFGGGFAAGTFFGLGTSAIASGIANDRAARQRYYDEDIEESRMYRREMMRDRLERERAQRYQKRQSRDDDELVDPKVAISLQELELKKRELELKEKQTALEMQQAKNKAKELELKEAELKSKK